MHGETLKIYIYIHTHTHTHRVIKKSLCTWRLQYKKQSLHNWWFEDGHHLIRSECRPWYTEQWTVLYWTVDRDILNSGPWYTEQCTVIYWTVDRDILNSGPWYTEQWTVLYWTVDRDILNSGPCYTEQWTVLYWTVDRAILNTVFENTVRRVSKCLETGGWLWTLLANFCIVIIKCTESFWSLCIYIYIYIYTHTHTHTHTHPPKFSLRVAPKSRNM
jgi:hypothetical protein